MTFDLNVSSEPAGAERVMSELEAMPEATVRRLQVEVGRAAAALTYRGASTEHQVCRAPTDRDAVDVLVAGVLRSGHLKSWLTSSAK